MNLNPVVKFLHCYLMERKAQEQIFTRDTLSANRNKQINTEMNLEQHDGKEPMWSSFHRLLLAHKAVNYWTSKKTNVNGNSTKTVKRWKHWKVSEPWIIFLNVFVIKFVHSFSLNESRNIFHERIFQLKHSSKLLL